MAVTYRHVETDRVVTAPEPGDEPDVRRRERARHIAQMDAASQWERVEVTSLSGPEPEFDDAAPPSDPPADPKPAEVRAWAREQDIEVSARGALPAELVERYRAAHA